MFRPSLLSIGRFFFVRPHAYWCGKQAVAVWEYDKRAVHGAAFCYCGMRMKSSADEVVDALIRCAFSSLDALGIRHGPAHSEIIMSARGPHLVETGARLHGVKGTFIWIGVIFLFCRIMRDLFECRSLCDGSKCLARVQPDRCLSLDAQGQGCICLGS